MSDLWLKWNSQQELLGFLDQLLESESFVDVTIAVEGQLLKAHRLVLCACSPYFNSILQSNPAPHPVIFMRDVKFVEIKAILDFIYKGEAYVSQEYIQGVLKTANALKVTGLSHIYWAESSDNDMQTNETSQSGVPSLLKTSKVPASVTGSTVDSEDRDEIIELHAEPLSSATEFQSISVEEGICELIEKEAGDNTESQPSISRSSEIYKEDSEKATNIGTSDEGKPMMVLVAPPNVSVSLSTPAAKRPKPIGRQYTKEDLQNALEMVRQGQMGIKPAARAFNIPVATLHHAARRRKISSPMQQGGNHAVSYRNRDKPGDCGVIVKASWSAESTSLT